jgi:hypothetical protein
VSWGDEHTVVHGVVFFKECSYLSVASTSSTNVACRTGSTSSSVSTASSHEILPGSFLGGCLTRRDRELVEWYG